MKSIQVVLGSLIFFVSLAATATNVDTLSTGVCRVLEVTYLLAPSVHAAGKEKARSEYLVALKRVDESNKEANFPLRLIPEISLYINDYAQGMTPNFSHITLFKGTLAEGEYLASTRGFTGAANSPGVASLSYSTHKGTTPWSVYVDCK